MIEDALFPSFIFALIFIRTLANQTLQLCSFIHCNCLQLLPCSALAYGLLLPERQVPRLDHAEQ